MRLGVVIAARETAEHTSLEPMEPLLAADLHSHLTFNCGVSTGKLMPRAEWTRIFSGSGACRASDIELAE